MTTRPKVSTFACVAAASAFAVMVAANSGSVLAHEDHHHSGDSNSGGTTSKVPVHGPGSSHNPIVSRSGGNAPPVGTVVRDHRNGKNCQYTVGDCRSMRAYRACEGLPYGGRCL
jgi:hypothetical protein